MLERGQATAVQAMPKDDRPSQDGENLASRLRVKRQNAVIENRRACSRRCVELFD